ncbi:MAG: MopE-related protein [Myxococcota bacterium]
MRLSLLLLISGVMSLACAGGGGDGDPETAVDADRDGYPAEDDCDDTNAAINPGVAEVCDAGDTDEDCNGAADDLDPNPGGKTVFFLDVDGDGYGIPTGTTTEACDAPDGFADNVDDCDDANAEVSPGAPEVCNDRDDDCDAEIDEDATDASTWFEDGDDDGFGDAAAPLVACEQPPGHVVDDTDCDDRNSATNPRASERCNGRDDDCDGDVDDDDESLDGSSGTTSYVDGDDDGYGDAASSVRTCALPAGYVTNDNDCDDEDGGVSPGAEEICENGVDDDCSGAGPECGWSGAHSLGSADGIITGSRSLTLGYGLAPLGDVDGDGYDDFGMGGTDRTELWIFSGAVSGTRAYTSADVAVTTSGASAYRIGSGDFDGDGAQDLVVSEYQDSHASWNDGSVWVIPGPVSASVSVGTDYVGVRYGEASGEELNSGRSAGDTDGDGYDDLLASSSANAGGGTLAGASWVVPGPITGAARVDAGAAEFRGEDAYDSASAAEPAGDVNGDGYDDVLIGAFGDDTGGSGGGAVYLMEGPFSSSLTDLSAADGKRYGTTASALLGPCSGIGDIDGDGYADVVMGALGTGTVSIVLGPWSGIASVAGADATLVGDADDSFGSDVASDGDVDGDGLSDVLVGGIRANDREGEVWLFLAAGGLSGTIAASVADATFTGEGPDSYAGTAVEFAGDLDADGFDDLLVAAHHDDDGDGRVYVYRSPTY